MHLSISFLAGAFEPVSPEAPKKLIELNDAEIRKMLEILKPVKELVNEVDPVVETGEYIELQKPSTLMHVDPVTHLVHDSSHSRCQIRVNFEAFKALAEKMKTDPADGLILSQFYKDDSTLSRLIQISGPAVSTWERDGEAESLSAGGPIPPNKLIMSYPLDDSRGLLKELVCTYSADDREIGNLAELANIEKVMKDKILKTDLMSTFRSPEINFLTRKASRASNPVIGNGEKAKKQADRYKDHI